VTISRCRPAARTFSFFATLCALLCACPLSAQNGLVVARAAGVSGQAVISNAGTAPLLLTTGYTLSPGDHIDTRGGGRVVIDLSDGSMVIVAPESMVVLKDYRTAASLRELFEITLGSVRVKINHFAGKPNPYRMNSPTASIAVRGTEFTITVVATGDTEVDVIEGLVEVSQRNDPSRSVLVEAGRGVLVQAGQNLRLLGANQPPPGNRDANQRGDQPNHDPRQEQASAPNQPPHNPPGPNSAGHGPQQEPESHQMPMGMPPGNLAKNDHDDDGSPRASASTYDRYLASLADIGQVPFLLRFNAFSEAHLDSLENPAYASQFSQAEGRVLFLPTFRGTRTLQEYQSAFGPGGSLPGGYSVSPQFSFFAPVAGFTLGGSASLSRIGDNSSTPAVTSPFGMDRNPTSISSSSTTNYYSGALVASRRFGDNSFGLELAGLKGSGGASNTSGRELLNSASDVTQSRITAGFARNLNATTTLGVFYRYAFIHADDHDVLNSMGDRSGGLNSTLSSGHSSEAGVRLRGMVSPRLYYGVTAAWLGISLGDALLRTDTAPSHARDRAQRGSVAAGVGYALTSRTVLSFDLAGGTGRTSAARMEDATRALVQNGVDRNRFVSLHAAVQHDLNRHIFVSASLLQVWQSHRLNVSLFGPATFVDDSFFTVASASPYASRFSDYGAGWRFAPNLVAQYVYSTDYGSTSATHTLMLRWTFHPNGR
jgi:hypothetical protein